MNTNVSNNVNTNNIVGGINNHINSLKSIKNERKGDFSNDNSHMY